MIKPKHSIGDMVYVDFTAIVVGVKVNQTTGKFEYIVRINNDVLGGLSEDYLIATPKGVEE